MMKTQNLILVIALFFAISCNKDKNDDDTLIEMYHCRFEYSKERIHTLFVKIDKVNKTLLTIERDTLTMSTDSVIGKLMVPFSPNKLNLKGKWSGTIFKKDFRIEESFTDNGFNHVGSYTYNGSFILGLLV